MSVNRPRLVAIHCWANGIGFVVFEGRAIYDWGTVVVRGDKNAMSLRKLGRLLDRYSPETLVFEQADATTRRSARILALHQAITELCQTRNIDVRLYACADVRRSFGLTGTPSRHDIAEAVARHIQVLTPRLPSRRKPWQSEPRRLAIFSAAAGALTHLIIEEAECRP